MRAVRISLVGFMLTVLVFVGVRADGAADETRAATERAAGVAMERTDDLDRENRRLKEENRLLRRQLKALREGRAAVVQPTPPAEPTRSEDLERGGVDGMPPGSVRREINGLTFYVIPL